MKNTLRLATALFIILVTVSVARADDAPYPGWAKTVVPPYPSVLGTSAINDSFYQLDTVDSLPYVLAWYKAHVRGSWKSSDSSTWIGKAPGRIQIEIQKNTYPGDLPALKKPKTLIVLTRHR